MSRLYSLHPVHKWMDCRRCRKRVKQHRSAVESTAQQVNRRANVLWPPVVHRPEIRAAAAIERRNAHVDIDRPSLHELFAQFAFDETGAEDDDDVTAECGLETGNLQCACIAH